MRTRILIAYDGSSCARSALEDLRRAGLPPEAEAVVVSVSEVWLPPPANNGLVGDPEDPPRDATEQALEAAGILRSSFPDWDVQAESCHGSPASVLLEKADKWRPDLIVVGSHGRSAIGRLFLGSVSHKIAIEANCSVRIARDLARETRTSARVLIAVDGSPGSRAAVDAVRSRVWPANSEARLVAVYDSVMPTMVGNFIPPVMQWVEDENKLSVTRARKMVASLSQSLRSSKLNISIAARPGDPKKVIVAEAQSWKADCIFVGATGLSPLDRFLLGSVSAAIASRAHCSVEIVRVPASVSQLKYQRRKRKPVVVESRN